MSSFIKEKPFSSLHSHSSQQDQQPLLVCTWSAHDLQSGPSKLTFPRYNHTLSATATAPGELFLFGGHISNNGLYVISTLDFSTTLFQTSGGAPSPRDGHGAVLTSTNLLIWGGQSNNPQLTHIYHRPLGDLLHLLNLVPREWTHIVASGPRPRGRYYHTMTMVGSKLFVFGGQFGEYWCLNDMWALDLNSLKSQPIWESYEPTPGNKKPSPRSRHVSVTTEDHIIVFGGDNNFGDCFKDTWSFNIWTRKWTELQCTGSIPPLAHAAVLVGDVMYVLGGSSDKDYLYDLYALQLSTLRWFKFHNVGTRPLRSTTYDMASDGTRVFVLGGGGAIGDPRSDEIPLIHVFDTKQIKYPEPERNAVDPNERTTQLARKSSTGHRLTQEQLQHPKSSSSKAHGASRLPNATPAVSGHPSIVQITHKRNPGPKGRPLKLTGVNSRIQEGDVSEGSTEYHAKFAAHHSSEEVARLKFERDQRIARLTDELALKSTLLEQAEANAAEASEASKRAELVLRKHANRLLTQTSLVKQRDAELVDMQARLDELLLSHNRQKKELANVRAKLEAKESELEAVRLRLTDAEKGWTKNEAEADTIRSQTATGSVNRDKDQVTRRFMKRMRAIEGEMASRRWSEKIIEEMECRNERETEYSNEGEMEYSNEG